MGLKRLNYGQAPGDGLGDILYDIFADIESNFVLTEGMTVGGVCSGTKYTQLRAGIKYLFLTPVVQHALYYVKELKVGTYYDSAHIQYRIIISKTYALNSVGTEFAYVNYIVNNNAPKTGLEKVALFRSFPTTGGLGTLVIDWDAFIQGTTYSCGSWLEGSLITLVSNPVSASGGGGGSGDDPVDIIQIDAADTVSGSESIYLINPDTDGMVITLDTIANIEGPINLKNIHDTHDVYIESSEYTDGGLAGKEFTIDGLAGILLHAKANITILPNVDHFIVSAGTYGTP